jgi:hypothetical protein
MAAGLQAGFAGVSGIGVPATAIVTANTRVKTTLGFVGTLADIVQFPGMPLFGNWVVPAMRCSINGVPAINQTSQGIAYGIVVVLTAVGPMQVTSPDPRASGM